ncbi:hypothetical protein ON010_g18665 [Phytophthora cinnamomi]|nr:hypothetical protein ON010_g18665 [Phytophthora cinnamomi]
MSSWGGSTPHLRRPQLLSQATTTMPILSKTSASLTTPYNVSALTPEDIVEQQRLRDGTLANSGSSGTLPPLGNAADLPPLAVRELHCTSFPAPRIHVKGEYYPAQAHQLAAHRMFKSLAEPDSFDSPMAFVLFLREHESRSAQQPWTYDHAVSPLDEMEQLQRGSTNANFSVDVGANAALPPAPAIRIVLPLRPPLEFAIEALRDREPGTGSRHPRASPLVMLFVNAFLGRALSHLAADKYIWWRQFCDATRAVDFFGAECLRVRSRQGSKIVGVSGAPRRGPATRTTIIPDYARRQIPRDTDGREPCLRFAAGGMCYSGSSERCGHPQRTLRWRSRLPCDVQEFIDRDLSLDRRPDRRADRRSDRQPDGNDARQ